MNLQSSSIYLLITILFSLSCSDNKQDIRLIETMKRLQQQNDIAQNSNRSIEHSLDHLISNEYSYEDYEYLQPSWTNFIDNKTQFSNLVSYSITSNQRDAAAIFKQYLVLQEAYKILKQRLTDSFKYLKLDTNINGFMNLDRKTFVEKYLSAKDSVNANLQLLFLQEDAIVNGYFLVESIIMMLSGPHSSFDFERAITTTDKFTYRNGEHLKLETKLMMPDRRWTGYTIIKGKQIEAKNGTIEYTQKINKKPGVHEFKFNVSIKRQGKIEIFPTSVIYEVE